MGALLSQPSWPSGFLQAAVLVEIWSKPGGWGRDYMYGPTRLHRSLFSLYLERALWMQFSRHGCSLISAVKERNWMQERTHALSKLQWHTTSYYLTKLLLEIYIIHSLNLNFIFKIYLQFVFTSHWVSKFSVL